MAVHIVNIHDAKSQLSRLLERVQAGEDIVIAKAGRPIVRMVVFDPVKKLIAAPGAMAGEIRIPDDFDAPVDEFFDALRPAAE